MTDTKLATLNIPRAEAIEFLKNKRPCASFIAINGYRAKTSGELADHTLILNVDYHRILTESLTTLKTIDSVNVDGDIYTKKNPEFKTAKEELELSLRRSLDNDNEQGQKVAEHFIPISKGVKIHKEKGTIHITGKKHTKRVIEKGEYKPVNSELKTKIKNAIKKYLPNSELRSFVLENNFDSLAMETQKFTESDFYEDI